MAKFKVLLLGVVLAICISVQGQNKENEISLSSFNIELDGEVVILDKTITATLLQDVPSDILIFKNERLSYRAVFTYKFKGRRAKLVRRTYVELPDGKKIFSKQKKEMQELKVSVPGLFKGKSAESILYNKRAMGSIFVSFNFEYSYK